MKFNSSREQALRVLSDAEVLSVGSSWTVTRQRTRTLSLILLSPLLLIIASHLQKRAYFPKCQTTVII